MLDINLLLCAFAGGIFGAAIGAVPSFILCGLAASIGSGLNMSTGNSEFSALVAWGPFLGPHVAFAGGVAAAAYAYRKGKLDTGRDIMTSLMGLDSPDILLIGGLFGILGYIIKLLLDLIPKIGNLPWTNTIALTIVISTIISRFIFGKSGILGKVEEGKNRWHPTENANWLPWQSQPLQLLLIAIGTSLPLAYIVVQKPALLGIGFGLSVVSLIFLRFGAKAPVIFHIALPAEIAAAATGNIWWGLAFGISSAFLGEIYACIFLNHGDTHIDPPSATIATMFTLLAVLSSTGVLSYSGALPIIISLSIALIGYFLMSGLRRRLAD